MEGGRGEGGTWGGAVYSLQLQRCVCALTNNRGRNEEGEWGGGGAVKDAIK